MSSRLDSETLLPVHDPHDPPLPSSTVLGEPPVLLDAPPRRLDCILLWLDHPKPGNAYLFL